MLKAPPEVPVLYRSCDALQVKRELSRRLSPPPHGAVLLLMVLSLEMLMLLDSTADRAPADLMALQVGSIQQQ